MRKHLAILLISSILLSLLSACSSILIDETLSVSPHDEPIPTATSSLIEAGSYEELLDDMVGFVLSGDELGVIRVNSYDGDIDADVNKACTEIQDKIPIGAYAVADMFGTVTQIVSYYEVAVNITYNQNIAVDDLSSIITISTIRYLKSDLQSHLSNYATSMTVQTNNIGITAESALNLVTDIYYDNPLELVMAPVASVEFYPELGAGGLSRIMEFTFGYLYKPSTLRVMEQSLVAAAQAIAESVTGNSDGAILLSLATKLMETTVLDEQTAISGDLTNQNVAATAYGALVTGSAISEGYAMAYKALCDELDIECYVVLGEYNDTPRTWNIIALDGAYYHVDIGLSDQIGLETSFLKSDDAMLESGYVWNRAVYKICNGPLTYYDVVSNAA